MHTDFQLLSQYGEDYPEWGSKPRRPLVAFDGAHKGEWLDSVIGPDPATGQPMIYHIVRCELCILTHAWPLPKVEDLARFYEREFYQVEKPDYIDRYEQDRRWWEDCVHDRILDTCRDHLRLDCPEEDQVVFLDIGAGPGIALDCAKRRGWITWGIEPNQYCGDRIVKAGHGIARGTFEAIWCMGVPVTAVEFFRYGPGPRPDIVYLYETLEHQPNPEDFLLACHELLEERGLLVVVVPNDYAPGQLEACERFGLARWWLAPPQHLHYFTPKTVQLLLRRCGFDLCDMRMTYPLVEEFLLGQGMCYVGNDTVGRECHHIRMQDELACLRLGQWRTLEQDYREAVAQRRGREIVCIARKR